MSLLIFTSFYLWSNTPHACVTDEGCHGEKQEEGCQHKGPSHLNITEGFCDPQDYPEPQKELCHRFPLSLIYIAKTPLGRFTGLQRDFWQHWGEIPRDFPVNSIKVLC